MIQEIVVALVVLAAAAVVVRKVVLALRPKAGTSTCDACALVQPDETPRSTSR